MGLALVFDFFRKKRQQKALRNEDDKELFVRKYKAFQNILKNNNEVLMTMADMQEKATGGFLFDRAYINSSYQRVAHGIKEIVNNLNILSDEKYKDLVIAYQKNDEAIRNTLSRKAAIPSAGYVLPLSEIGKGSSASTGGKLALLGELANVLGFSVPPGFIITTYAYETFIKHNKIDDILKEQTGKLNIRNYDELTAASQKMQKLVRNAEMPPDLETAIFAAYRGLCDSVGKKDLAVSVRSSALHEDIMASFAGQYDTALNVPAEDLVVQYRNVVSSQFTPRALFYYKDKGFHLEEMAMAVGIMAMVDAKTSGVMYSRDPGRPEEDVVLISAVWGLGTYAVGGIVPTDSYRVSGGDGRTVTREESGPQEIMLTVEGKGGTRQVPVPEELAKQPRLTHEQVRQLASCARRAEKHFGHPQDMEWAIDRNGRLYFLQSRPLRLPASLASPEEKRPRVIKGHKILLDKGVIASRGVGAGPVYVVKSEDDLAGFPDSGVLVIRHTLPEFAVVLQRASAVVSDIGTVLGHLATVAREYNVPAIFNTEKATRVLTNGMQVTVDAIYANVYEGVVQEILREKKTADPFRASPVLKQLQDILQKITPLNLTDPRSPDFTPRGCKTFHDITRFAHEMALKEIFEFAEDTYFSERSAKKLVSKEIPLDWLVIDLGGGVRAGAKGKDVQPEDIVSIPMRAMWEGMTAVPWKGPPPMDTKGFLSVVAGSATAPDTLARLADKNYIVVAKQFCNVSTRLGFHFSTTEAYTGEEENQNYISFIFKGGGADDMRRNRRAAFIARILDKYDFRVEVKQDAVFARIEGHTQRFLEERLRVLGHVIVHTRQMDMVMYNERMVDWYYKDMLKAIESFVTVTH